MTEKMTFEQNFKEVKGTGLEGRWKNRISPRRSSQCQDLTTQFATAFVG